MENNIRYFKGRCLRSVIMSAALGECKVCQARQRMQSHVLLARFNGLCAKFV